jgi:hypothetical protein
VCEGEVVKKGVKVRCGRGTRDVSQREWKE